jgi:hypothetical protein
MMLTTDQRKKRGLSGHFGDRSLQGLYLGCQVDGSRGSIPNIDDVDIQLLDDEGGMVTEK